jgi:hypothetical protein
MEFSGHIAYLGDVFNIGSCIAYYLHSEHSLRDWRCNKQAAVISPRTLLTEASSPIKGADRFGLSIYEGMRDAFAYFGDVSPSGRHKFAATRAARSVCCFTAIAIERSLLSAIVLSRHNARGDAYNYRKHALTSILIKAVDGMRDLPLQAGERQASGKYSVE